MSEIVVMVTTSYPRFPGDTIGTFMEPIAKEIARRGHEVHVVLPWHPRLERDGRDGGLTFHSFKYAPHPSLNVFGYATALEADVAVRGSAWLVAPLAMRAGISAARRVAGAVRATVLHGHWVIPGGSMAMLASSSLPLVVSLHGSDVFVAERHGLARRIARATFARAGWTTACSADLRDRAVASLGLDAARSNVVPYGVDVDRFAPNRTVRAEVRRSLGMAEGAPLVFAAGRFVRKKGFEYLIEALAKLVQSQPDAVLVLGGDGDLREVYERDIREAGLGKHVRLPGVLLQPDVARYLAAADVAVVPSIRDEAGNVDGLPNAVLETLSSGTALVSTPVGGIPAVVTSGENGMLVPERNAEALARALESLLADPARRQTLGTRARQRAIDAHSWAGVAARFEDAYDRARKWRQGKPV